MMKRFTSLVTCVFLLLHAGCQHNPHSRIDAESIRAQTDNLFEKLVALRRDLHMHPELAGNEVRTAATVAAHLRKLGLDVQTGQYGHSVVGILRGGRPGKTIAWRAELDALPGDFAAPVAFKSRTPGVHHACGHDVHIAIALGIAEILAKNRASLQGNAVFIFQPEEETFKGAKALVERGVFSSLNPDEIYGVHVTPLPVGQIVVRANEMFAYQRRIRIRLSNELSAAQIEALTRRVTGALMRTRPGAKPWEIQNIADSASGITAESTAFQDYLIVGGAFDSRVENNERLLEADVYETDQSKLGGLIAQIEQAVEAGGHKSQLRAVSFVQENLTVQNNARLTRLAMQTLQRAHGADLVRPAFGQAPFFNDDFAYFQQKVPGVYFFLGGSNAAKGIIAMNHAPNFQVDEESIRVGVKSFSSLMIARLGGSNEAE
jgi:metal-dependent amidase/aminoacylase/carboxypeptidase family protein